MRKIIEKVLRRPDSNLSVDVNKVLSQTNTAYVLITCGEPSKDGKMQVEMTYQGDEGLASYLLESAQRIIDK
jgi:hypothetical protein